MNNFNPILLSAFTDFEENKMLTEILQRIENKEAVTLNDVAMMAFTKYYSPISIAKKYLKYGSKGVINLDEAFVHTYLYKNRVVWIKNVEKCEVVRGKKFNAKEGTTIIAISRMEDDEQIPFAIVAEGRSAVCERKYGVDEELILYSPSGWTNGQIMVKYLEWLAEKMRIIQISFNKRIQTKSKRT